MEKLLLDEIIINYGIDCDTTSLVIKVMESYPHIFMLSSLMEDLIVKKVNKNYCKSIDYLYDYLSNIRHILLPKKNINDSYSFTFNEEKFLIYKKISEIKTSPGPIWWADCLRSIHNIKVNNNDFNYLEFNLYNETLKLLNSAFNYLDDMIKNKINILLNMIDKKNQMDTKLVLCHSDPCDKNVMLDNQCYKLIDTDMMRLLPKEFDIQRLLSNVLINSNSVNHSLDYWHNFLNNYEKDVCDIINVNLLKNIYICDLVRTFSWLAIVSSDLSRLDHKRQMEEFKLYKQSIIDDSHIKLLKKL